LGHAFLSSRRAPKFAPEWGGGSRIRWIAADQKEPFKPSGTGIPERFKRTLSKTVRIPKKHFDWALAQYFQVGKTKICPQFCPQYYGICGRSRLAILRWSRVVVDGFQCTSGSACTGDAWMIGCPGQGTKRLVRLHRFRPSLAVASTQFQLGRSGNADAWFAQAATCRARPHGDDAVHYRQDRDPRWTGNRHHPRAAIAGRMDRALALVPFGVLRFQEVEEHIELILSEVSKTLLEWGPGQTAEQIPGIEITCRHGFERQEGQVLSGGSTRWYPEPSAGQPVSGSAAFGNAGRLGRG